ncbi:MAG TPA: HlyD family efflux transporter periplasmic adaptor subunit [Phycisphaerae bacterium]|jgi:HlyD family secretion protein|nr:HlyD family efflux transporter periplasmic adaptor subunit [Phycisphaerae bacterium]HOB74898.1 HlyD family efflux transporter periplasmic adaptor subunit [Phycisphaerae bacterium]HOJ53759.1 HlyD family efflux transporter periplasmic adaptor subunit [Phycisphaerae bacterium]HOL27301.1 HlyD family efflux transporter periplasmic adaptor subunit [Phycisphaerae bacterium]HPP21441.1 HlyD family efflux transporter periplasmic adaptor subunit [Phycisphaerae bacterium]
MKKFIVLLLVIGALGGGYYAVRKYARIDIGAIKGETSFTTRGDLDIPITASGHIQPASVRRLKSKASGEIIETPFILGAMVRQGDLVIKLLDVDERRSVERAQTDHNRAQIALEQALLNLKQRKGPAQELALAKLKSAEARLQKANADFEFRKNLLLKQHGIKVPDDWTELANNWPTDRIEFLPREEFVLYATTRLDAHAAVLAARAELDQAELAVRMAEQEVATARENVAATKVALDDAQERLNETEIRSPIDGMILAQPVQVGEISQGGKMTITGGTLLVEIADISQIYAVVNVDEADIGQIHTLAPAEARPGTATQPALDLTEKAARDEIQTVKVRVETFPDEDFRGVITQISPQSESVAGVATFKVWIQIVSPNRDKLIGLLNTQAEAHFTAKAVRNAILVPYDAVQKNPHADGYGVYVPVPRPNSNVREPKFVPCKFGADNGMVIEVREGLQEGQEVYVKLPPRRDDQK